MKLTVCLLTVLMLVGCTSKQHSSSLSEKLSNIFSEDGDYHFRKVKWGYSKEAVELAERGNTVFERKDNAIVYKCKINGVYCRLIYTFEDNRLRTAGYITITPLPNADNLLKEAVDKHGVPETNQTYCDGLQEMVWKTQDTVIFANLFPTIQKRTSTNYGYSRRGLLRDLVYRELPDQETGKIYYWDGTYAHIDPAFFSQLHDAKLPLSELSFYQKRLIGIILRKGGTQIPGLGTIPR